MVTAPKCKVCGSSHFGSAHVWSGSVAKPPPAVVEVRSPDPPVRLAPRAIGPVKRGRPPKPDGPTFDKRTYQREYMAKLRAAARLAKPR